MEIQYQCGLQDYLEAQYAHYRRSAAFYVVAGGILGFAGILGLYQMITEGYPQGYPLLAIVVLWALLRFVCRPLWFRRDFRKHPNFAIRQAVRVEENGVSYKSDLGQSETNWNAFAKFRETPNLFMIYSGARLFHVIPKRAFAGPELDGFRRLLQQKLATK
jgi:hypothetical protein